MQTSFLDDLQRPYQIGSQAPGADFTPDTSLLKKTDFTIMTKLSSGEPEPRWKKNPSSNIVNTLMSRENFSDKNFSRNTKCKINNTLIPNKFDILVGYAGHIDSSMFSKDGQHFITASERKIKIFDSANESYDIKKSMSAKHVRSYITNLDCSPNNESFVYSTLSPIVTLCKLADGCNEQIPLVVDEERFRHQAVFTVAFSANGIELLCGSEDGYVYIYNLGCQRTTLKMHGHRHGVNSVAFAHDSSNLLYTGGNDGVVQLWDRRTLSVNCPKPVGYMAGHTGRVKYIHLRDDGRHLITNSRDGSIKLWDVRRLSSESFAKESVQIITLSLSYCHKRVLKAREVNDKSTRLDGDCSIMTYRGHEVSYSTITCKFSPVETTGQRYIYTGCDSGGIVVYDALTGKAVQHQVGHNACVFHVSWHPTRREILSTGEDGIVGIWTYMNPNTMMEPEQIEIDRKHFSSFKFRGRFLLNPARKCRVQREWI